MTATATHPGVVTYPGLGIGVRGEIIAVPLTEGEVVVLDDGITLGPATCQTDATGTLQGGGLKVPIVTGVLWDVLFEPFDHELAKVRLLEAANLNTSGVALHLLTSTIPTVVDEGLITSVSGYATAAAGSATAAAASAAAAAAVGSTNDGIIAGVVNNPASATRAALTRTGTKPVGQGELGLYNVLDYGAVGDGEFDNQTAIAAAKTAATAAGGGIIFFPYTVAGYRSSSTSLASNLVFRGENRVLLRRMGGSTALFINATAVTNCGIENMTIDPAGIATTAALRLGTGTSQVKIRNCRFTDSGITPVLSIDVQTGTSDLYIEDNDFNNSPRGIGDLAVGAGTATLTGATDLVTTPAAHGLITGDPVRFASITTTTGITAATTYYVKTTPTTTTLTLSAATNLTATLDLVGDGSATGMVKFKAGPVSSATFTAATDLVTTPVPHGLAVGEVVSFATITTTTGITAGAYYFVKTVPSTTTLTLSIGAADVTLDLVGDGTGTGMAVANPVQNGVKLGGNVVRGRIRRNVCAGWKERFLYVLGTTTDATNDLRVIDNNVMGMVPGGISRQPITVQGVDSAMHLRPRITGNTVLGAFVSYDDTNLVGCADLISLHRSEGGDVSGNTCHGGGDVGITISMQCSGMTINGNNCQFNDTVGMSLGSATATDTSWGSASGNTCINNGQSRQVARPYRSGINCNNASNWTISGNMLGDSQNVNKVSDSSAVLTAATDLVTTPTAHGLEVGARVRFKTITTSTGIAAGTIYYVKTAPSSTTLTLSATAGGTTLDITGANGTAGGFVRLGKIVSNGTVTFTAATNTVTTPTAHGLTTGTVVQFSTIVTTTGITANTNYYVKTAPTATTLTLSATSGGATLVMTGDGTGAGFIKPGTQQYGFTLTNTDGIAHYSNGFQGAVIASILRSGTNTNELDGATTGAS